MFGSILHRMILAELVKVFLLSLASLTGMFLLAGLIQEASQRGLSPGQIIAVIPLLIPNTLPYTIPATTLFATCVVYGRMSHDNEVLVIKAAGVNILNLLKPAIFLGVLTSAITMGLYYHPIPYSQQVLRSRFLSDAEEVIYSVLKRERCLRASNMPYSMYIREVQGKRLVDVIVKRRVKVNGAWFGYDLVARAREAKLRVDVENNQINIDMERCVVYGDKSEVSGNFAHRSFPVPLPESIFGKDHKTRPMALTWEELRERQAEVARERQEFRAGAEEAEAKRDRATSPAEHDQYAVEAFHLRNKLKEADRMQLQLDAEVQMRPALAMGCLCFVLVGCPVGIWASRADYLSTFVICFLPTVFLYYPLLLCGSNLGKDGKMAMAPAVWAADAIVGCGALFLIFRLMRR